MAESHSHKFGQIIGDLLEIAIQPHLAKFAEENNLFLDKKGERLIRKGKKVSWTDIKENIHDLDFVLERNGTNEAVGVPVAFIEIAWRRYTKHSRNKAQEIQGAILPLAEKFKSSSPFLGVVLAGEFTKGAINQLQSSGFNVLYFPYDTVVYAFQKFGINASFNEQTSEEDFKSKIESWSELENKNDVAKELLKLNENEVDRFFKSLTDSVSRFIERIIILTVYGKESTLTTVNDAIDFLNKYSEEQSNLTFERFEIIVKYNSGDKIDASFKDKKDAIKFLQNYL